MLLEGVGGLLEGNFGFSIVFIGVVLPTDPLFFLDELFGGAFRGVSFFFVFFVEAVSFLESERAFADSLIFILPDEILEFSREDLGNLKLC